MNHTNTQKAIDDLLKTYAVIDTNELGEDKFRGNYNLPEARTKILALLVDTALGARISELDWAISRLNQQGRETISQTLHRAINEIDDAREHLTTPKAKEGES